MCAAAAVLAIEPRLLSVHACLSFMTCFCVLLLGDVWEDLYIPAPTTVGYVSLPCSE